jgi:hypothetical protein
VGFDAWFPVPGLSYIFCGFFLTIQILQCRIRDKNVIVNSRKTREWTSYISRFCSGCNWRKDSSMADNSVLNSDFTPKHGAATEEH